VGHRTVKNEHLWPKAEFLKLVARAAARCVAKNLNIYIDIHYLNTKITMALSIAERHNLTHIRIWIERENRSRSCARASCAAESPQSARSDLTEIKVSPPKYHCNKQSFNNKNRSFTFIFKQLKFWHSQERVSCTWKPFFRWVEAEIRTENRTADNIQSETRIYPTVFAGVIIQFFFWRCGPTRVMASSFLRFLDHTQRCITVGRTPLDE
jgi:hypothetical protein